MDVDQCFTDTHWSKSPDLNSIDDDHLIGGVFIISEIIIT